MYDALYRYDYIHCEANKGYAVGKKIILPSSFQGSPRAMAQKYQDAMCIVGEFGTPDLFITMTANPKWDEITEQLESYETATDRPDIVARDYNAKRNALMEDITKNHVLTETEAIVSQQKDIQKNFAKKLHCMIILLQSIGDEMMVVKWK